MMKINKIQNTNLNLKVRGQGCADDCTEKKCGLENSTVIHKVVSTMIPPTLPKLRLGGNL